MKPQKILLILLVCYLLFLPSCDMTGDASEAFSAAGLSSAAALSSETLSSETSFPQASSSKAPASSVPMISTPQSKASSVANTPSAAEKLLQKMTLEEKVGQLFVIRPEALHTGLTFDQVNSTKSNGATTVNQDMLRTLQQYPVGGIALFAKNITSPEQLTALTASLQQASRFPLLIGVDEEGGRVARIASNSAFSVTKYTSMQSIGQTGNSKNAYQVGLTIGSYLRQYGLNLDFAPDSDTNTNPLNIVIGDRSFGSDPALVSKMVSAEIDGLHEAGVMSCIKHFPGHGDTKGDTHNGYVSVKKDWQALLQCELIPFIGSLEKTDLVMAAHITVPNVTTDGLPSSLSRQMITDRLRKELGYNGVVITDSLSMGAITQQYTTAKAAVATVQAGVDLILMPADLVQAYQGVLDAVNSGEISKAALDRSVLRILSLKEKYGLLG